MFKDKMCIYSFISELFNEPNVLIIQWSLQKI